MDVGQLPFLDRTEAGRVLAAAVRDADLGEHPVVLGLPRGGVPVAAPVAAALGAPLDVLVVRKLGTPASPELAMGAVASGGVRVVNTDLVRRLGLGQDDVERVAAVELAELERREQAYRGEAAPVPLAGRTAVLVDDGLATGATVRAAVQCVRAADPGRVVVAVPVGSPSACAAVEQVADALVCPHRPVDFRAVGAYYADFGQTGDEEVRRLLRDARG